MAKEKKVKPKVLPRVHKDLAGFDIEIDSFGEIKTSFDINKINEFLNREMDDKKLRKSPLAPDGETGKE
jgi:hypothetical protein